MNTKATAFALIAALSVTSANATEPREAVDLMIGVRGAGSCVPGPCLPNGSIHPSPDTLPAGNGGYARSAASGESAPLIAGFSQLHVQGSGGVKSYGNFLITPQVGLAIDEREHLSGAREERATASRYQVRLAKNDIFCEVTPGAHSAIYRFRFPASDQATITLDVARNLNSLAARTGFLPAMDRGQVKVDPTAGTISGGGQFRRNWNPAPYTLYFAAKVSKPPAKIGIWKAREIQPNVHEAAAENADLGAYLQWKTEANEAILLKIAVSFVSEAQAQSYLDKEIPAWNFAATEKAAQDQWDHMLSSIQIEGATADEEKTFYTAMYHTMVQPRDRTGDNANWKSNAPFFDDQYTMWDTWRTQYPLMAIIRPDLVRDNIDCFIDRHEHHGYVATAFIQGKEYRVGQGGDDVDPVIADAFVKKVPGVDWEKAYGVLKYHADAARTVDYRERGYASIEGKHDYDTRFRPASATLAFSYDDFCIAQVARGLGKDDDCRKYLARSGNWKNTWDDSLTDSGFAGFPRNRHQDGSFGSTPARAGHNTDFYEGTCWIFSYSILQDFPGMMEKMGGRDKFIERLQFALQNNLIDFTNEPSFQTTWWLSAAGRPDLAAYWADKLKAMYTLQGYPGDEDAGAMSSLYVFLTAGFFPIAGQDIYYLHGTRVPRMRWQVGGGKTFTVIGRGAGADNIYVQSATLNGQPLEHPWITHENITGGGTLEFVMGRTPSKWGWIAQ